MSLGTNDSTYFCSLLDILKTDLGVENSNRKDSPPPGSFCPLPRILLATVASSFHSRTKDEAHIKSSEAGWGAARQLFVSIRHAGFISAVRLLQNTISNPATIHRLMAIWQYIYIHIYVRILYIF